MFPQPVGHASGGCTGQDKDVECLSSSGYFLLASRVGTDSSVAPFVQRWLEAVSDQASRRVEQLFRELQASAPLISYRSLVHRHARLQV